MMPSNYLWARKLLFLIRKDWFQVNFVVFSVIGHVIIHLQPQTTIDMWLCVHKTTGQSYFNLQTSFLVSLFIGLLSHQFWISPKMVALMNRSHLKMRFKAEFFIAQTLQAHYLNAEAKNETFQLKILDSTFDFNFCRNIWRWEF